MGLVLFCAVMLWGLGWMMNTPLRSRFVAILLLWLGVVTLHLILPEGHVLRMSLGETAAPYLMLGALALGVLAYRAMLKRLRAKAQAKSTPQAPGRFTPTELDRYARHIVLHEIGGSGQKKLKNASVMVIGAGGLGAPVLSYLAAGGVGTIGVIDDDIVANSNLQRQVLFRDDMIGMPKVFAAQKALEAQNPYVVVKPYNRRLEADIATELFKDYDLIIDGSDNFSTRYMVNQAATEGGVPLLSGAISQWEGQLSLFHPASGAPCYACVFPKAPAAGLAPSCAEAGVIGALPGIVGSMIQIARYVPKRICKMTNPLLESWKTPFGLAPFDRIGDADFEPALDEALAAHKDELRGITDNVDPPTFANTVQAFEASGALLDQVLSVFFTVSGADSNNMRQDLQRKFSPKLSAHMSAIYGNTPLFERLRAVEAQDQKLDHEDARLLELTLRGFWRAGAGLTGDDEAQMRQIMSKLAELGTRFTQNLLADEASWFMPLEDTKGLPDFLIKAARAAGEERGETGPVVTLSRSLVTPFLQFSPRRDLREKAYKAFTSRGAMGGNGNG